MLLFEVRKLFSNHKLLAKVLVAGSVLLCSGGNVLADLQITKTIDPITPSPAAESDFIRYNLSVTNTGPGVLTNVIIQDLPDNLNNLNFTVTSPSPPPNGPLGGSRYRFNTLAAGETVTLNLDATVNTAPNTCPVISNTANVSENTGTFTDSAVAPNIEYDFQFTSGLPTSVVTHNALTSFCELCGDGVVSITVQNPTGAPLTNITIVEDLQASGLEYINNSTTVTSGSTANPTINGTQLTWTSAQLSALANLAGSNSFVITFGVRSSVAENLVTADRDIVATADFDMSCLAARQSVNTGQFELPIRQPLPTILKNGRNYDAGQTLGSAYTDPVYGNFNDDIIWQVNVNNVGLANMEALRMNDSINGNFSINFICPTEASAEAIATANGAGGAPCIAMTPSLNVADPFGNIANPDDVAASSNTSIYYVGRVLNTHTNNTNTADISWGCAVDSPTGGSITVPASTGGVTPVAGITETGTLSTTVIPAALQVTQTVTGSNPGQPLGTKGLMTITLNNQTGGSVKSITVATNLPAGYVLDETYGVVNGVGIGQPTSTRAAAYGNNYPGFIDTVTRDDPQLNNGNPLDDLNPTFTLTSISSGADAAQQKDMLRNGDVVSFTFGIIMIDPTRFDLVADLDVAPENTGDGTDPTNAISGLNNNVIVNFDAVDPAGLQSQTRNVPFTYDANPEDLDVSISDALFILTNDPGTPLALNVDLTNNGGHDADDYSLYVSLGQAMTAQLPYPNGCSPTSNAPPHPTWNSPATIPGPLSGEPAAAVYVCNRNAIAPGQTQRFTFNVIKQLTGTPADDLTFRADLTGEVTLFDGNRLTFSGTPASPNLTPPSLSETSPNQQLANNYSLDAIRSRVLGFNLVKSAWYCAEDNLPQPAIPADILTPTGGAPNTPPMTGNMNSQIGEDCNYRIESGGWFGFVTPGFQLIEVQDVAVTDDLPNGQGFIPFGGSPFNFNNTGNIILVDPVTGGAGTTPLDETDITWNFNTATGINVKDEFFRVDFKTRLLNDPIDGLYPVPGGFSPNLHGNLSTNVARTSFTAIFQSDPIAGVPQPQIPIPVSDSLNIPGYPLPAVRTVNLTDVEPNLLVTKEVCNEDLYGIGPTGTANDCTNFVPLANDGDTNDSYIYRITLTNETSTPVRTPAYNVIATDILDSSDLMLIADFDTDKLDNDGDGLIDAADFDGEGSISENVANGLLPAVITVSHLHSTALLKIDPGVANSVVFYYRVDPDDAIAPLQILTNTISTSYDSLEGDYGNQNPPQVINTPVGTSTSVGTAGSARVYKSIDTTADVQMIPLLAQPKEVVALSNTTLGGSPHDVVVGEEVQYQLTAQLPVANLRAFKIRDELPAGIRCIEGQVVNLNAPPYTAAGFNPGGVFTPTCTHTGTNDFIEWDFGDQELTMSPGITRFNFVIDFIARVENTAVTNEGVTITNGGGTVDPATCTGGVAVCYVNEASTPVALNFAAVSLTVREPVIALTKSFAVTNSDAADILTVTVTAENTGNAAAYNLRILDDLVGADMTYINDSMSGPDAPDDDGVAADSKSPTFSWLPANLDYEIQPGVTKTFTFQVQVDTSAQPLEILDNTIQAKWDSLPAQTKVLNSAGRLDAIGVEGNDGGVLGMRTGVLPNNPADAINDYETAASDSTSVLPLTLDKVDRNPGLITAIGAHKNFEIVITLPEGTTNNLVVTDDLNFSGLSYALSRNASYDVSYTFNNIISINGAAPSEAAFAGAVLTTLPVDNATGTIQWNIGTVVTDEENDSAVNLKNPSITINYFARVNNDLVTDSGDTLQNSATVTYDNGENPATTEVLNDTTAIQNVLEPVLTFNPVISVTNQTPGKAATDLPDSGDILEYQITLANSGTSEAFDVNISSTLPAQLLLDTSLPNQPTALINGVAAPGFVAAPAGSPAGPLVWGRGNGDNGLDIPAGQSLVLTYRTIVQTVTEPNTLLTTSVSADWTSLDDLDPSTPFERTGAGCPTFTAPDDYCIGPQLTSISTIDDNSIVKSIILDTYDTGLSTALDSTVRVGDTVTYRLELNIQEGTTRSVNVVDTLPVGMTFVDVISINGDTTADYDAPATGAGSNFSYATITAASVPTAGDTLALNWNLGDVSNDAAGDATTDTIVIEYRARVTENAGIAQVATTTLSNTADLNYIDGNGAPSPSVPRLTSTANLTVLQPIMDALTKTDRSGRVSGNTINVATDVMNFRLHSCNSTGLAPAYGLLITDDLPTQLDETSLVGPTNGALAPDVFINGVLATEGVANDYVYTPPATRGGDMVFFFNTPINPGACVDIDFDIPFYTDFAANQSWSNALTLNEYYSLPPADAQLYPAVGPVTFDMNNLGTVFPPPEKTMISPVPAVPDASIGDEIIYQIKVPATPINAVLYDVTITDTLNSSLLYLSATDISGNSFAITDNTVLPGQVNLVIGQIPAGQQAIIELHARVDNNANANAGVSFINTAAYTFANTPAGVPINGGSDNTTSTLNIVEPLLTVAKSVVNLTKPGIAPDAGDVLRYTITLTASGGAVPGDLFSDAFDVTINDTLSLGLLFAGNQTVNGAGNTLDLPIITGDGITTPQSLNWSLAGGNADIDVTEGTVVTVDYRVVVLDAVQANQALTNTVNIQWHSRDGPDVNQRDGSGTPALNDYFNVNPVTTLQTTPDDNTISKSRLSDTYGAGDDTVRIGDIVDYELRLNLQEGTHPNAVVVDTLPAGLIFEQVVSINGDTVADYDAPAAGAGSNFSYSTIPAVNVPAAGATGALNWNLGTIVNTGDNLANNDFVIVYRARVLNLVLPQQNNIALNNSVNFDYLTQTGAAQKVSSYSIDVLQPALTTGKTAAPAGGDTVIEANELITYTVEIANTGTSPAYDTELRDIIPLGLRNGAATVTTISTGLVAGTALPNPNPVTTVLPNVVPSYDALTGNATWNFDSGIADQYSIPPGQTLRIVYQVQADAGMGAGLTLTNAAQVQRYYSFDDEAVPAVGTATGVREIYGPSNIAQVSLSTDAANPLLKENKAPVDLEASIGETFTYTITVPGAAQPTALYDVRILDNLNTSAADLQFVSVTKVSGSLPWVPVNIGTTADDLIIADVTNGIDIPANEQAVIEITVTLRDSDPPNVAGLLFHNEASYTFNQIDNDASTQSNGMGNTTVDKTVVEPELTLDKRGPAGTVNFTVPVPYTLVVENIGTGPAFDSTIVDRLPDVTDNPPLTGGTCDAAPLNFDARITSSADEVTVLRALTLGVDYTAVHTAAPTCELVITTITDAARIEAGEKFIISYEASLDPASQSGASLTNIAGVTRWFSLDTAGAGATGEIREYTRAITDGTPSVTDHQDAFTVIVEAPVLVIQKTVINVTTGQNPGTDASPGDTLRYAIQIQNTGTVSLPNFSITDEVDALAPASGFFAPGSISNIVIPAGADSSNTNINGGANGAGLLDVRNLSVDAAGGANDTVIVQFDVTLRPVITSGTVVLNQAQLNSAPTGVLLSDDPLVGGMLDPTQTLIASAPAFVVQKTSLDITGDPAVLVAGDTLRYMLQVKNTGQEDAINTLLSDQIPANTTYVAGSTTLNTVVVADPSAGISALAAGMLINAPENTTAGFMRADSDPAANNVATITFDVVISSTVVDGTVISNQGFVSGDGAGSGIFPQQPSDDPATALVDDPTLDVVGNVPVVDVQKTVAIVNDLGTLGIVDPGDTLRYTITTSNIGAIPATGVVLTDGIPVNTTYVANSSTLNGIALADTGVSISPLFAGLDISSSDLTPPLPLAGAGTLTAGQSAVVTFDVTVGTTALPLPPAGTIISNQGFVDSNETPVEPTDADGNDANGDQPTVIVVGNVQQLAITKQVLVVGGGAAIAGGQLEYVVRVSNIGSIAASNVVITDNLDLPVASQMTYIAGSGLLNGLPVGVSSSGSTVTANYAANYGDLPVAGVAELRFRVALSASLTIGETVFNTAYVDWNLPASTLSATADIDIGGTPGAANLNGQLWHDADFDNVLDADETLLSDWRVELYRNSVLLASTQSDANGAYQFSGLVPNLPSGDAYEIRFVAPGAVSTTATLGRASSIFTNGPQRISDILAASGSSVQNLNLPRQPNGIVYDSVLRAPVPGVQLRMVNQTRSNQVVPGSCFDDPAQQNQVTLVNGYYKFALNFSDPARCAQGDEYEIQVQPPADGYVGTTSVIIPPVIAVTGAAQDVPNCPGNPAVDKIPATTLHCENSVSAVQPDTSIAARTPGTDYYLKFLFNNADFTNQIYNNHIPVDPELESAVAISKVAGLLNVTVSQLVPYTITVSNTLPVPLQDLNVVDTFPAGFKYVAESARVDGVAIEPAVNGRQLTWQNLNIEVSGKRVIKLLLVVGSGVAEGEYVNTAQVINSRTNEAFSGVASATVRVIPDPTFDCTDIIGKVFDDKNLNAYQDEGEKGLPGVQVATARGLRVTTDAHGRFHITCAVVPNEVRGSNFIMKLDDRTLPSGYRVVSENPRVERATRGKMLKFNFAAALHRVVRLDLADGVFEKGSTVLRPQWRSRIDLLIIELQKDPSILRLSYLGENESEADVDDRLDAIEELVSKRWEELDCCYKLTIEKEVFWRKGNPSERKKFE